MPGSKRRYAGKKEIHERKNLKGSIKSIVAILGVILGQGAGAGIAQSLANNEMACIQLDRLQATDIPPRLACSVRDCIAQERYDDAMRLYLAYSSFGLFDQQRVKDESGHAALVDLTAWIFGGHSRDVMDGLRAVRDRMRDRDGIFFLNTCEAIAKVGPPDYHPAYLIARGIQPRKSDNDWAVEGFDAGAAWHKSLVELNGCPSV